MRDVAIHFKHIYLITLFPFSFVSRFGNKEVLKSKLSKYKKNSIMEIYGK